MRSLRSAISRRRLSAIVGISAAVALGASACVGGGGNDAAPSASTVRSAYAATTASKTAKTSLSAKLAANGRNATQAGKGVVNFGNGRMDLSFQAQGGSYETRLVGDTLYQHLKKQAQAPPGKSGAGPWLKVDLPKIAAHEGGSQFVAAQQRSNPAHLLSYLEAVHGSVQRKGTDTVGGARSTHYRATVDLDSLAGTPGHSKKVVSALKKEVGGHTLPVDVWLDTKHRVVQQRMVFPLTQPAAGPSSGNGKGNKPNLTVTTRFYDYGARADINRPSGKVLDATPIVLRRLGG